MTARIIDGKAIAADLRIKVAGEVRRLSERHGVTPGLAVVLAGSNPASESYVGSKAKVTVETGMRSFDHRLPETVSQDELLALVRRLNADPAVHGILVQLPLPPQIDASAVLAAIDPSKDVDGFHPVNAGRLAAGLPALTPCTPLGCILLAKTVHDSLAGLEAVVVGRSNIVGKPVAQLLLAENATVTVTHSKTRDLPAVCRRADLLDCSHRPAGNGARRLDQARRDGDRRRHQPRAGQTGGKSRIVGDVAFAEAAAIAGAITPVPGGVGPMTIACLMVNTVRAACAIAGLPKPVGLNRIAVWRDRTLMERVMKAAFGLMGLALVCVAGLGATPVASQTVSRVYTQFDADKCRHTRGKDGRGLWRPGAAPAMTASMSISAPAISACRSASAATRRASRRRARPSPPSTAPTKAPSNGGSRRRRTASRAPFATILRWNVKLEDDEKDTTGRVLVVTRLGPGGVCHVGYVDARANPNANELAQQLADARAPRLQVRRRQADRRRQGDAWPHHAEGGRAMNKKNARTRVRALEVVSLIGRIRVSRSRRRQPCRGSVRRTARRSGRPPCRRARDRTRRPGRCRTAPRPPGS